MIRWDKLTFKVREATQHAQHSAQEQNHQQIEVEHLLLALIQQQDSIIRPILSKLGANPNQIIQELQQRLQKLPRISGASGETFVSPYFTKILEIAFIEAQNFKDDFVSTEHLLLAISRDSDGEASKILAGQGVSREKIIEVLKSIRGTQRITDQSPEDKYQDLRRFSRDLSLLARQGKKEPSIFLCHNSNDKIFVRELAKDLQSKGVKCWVDEAEMLVGDSLILKISKAIEEMEYLGAILSPNSIESNWVIKELSIAMTEEIEHKKIKVLPILYKKCRIPNFLADKLYADFTKNYQEGLSALLRRLIPNMNKDNINNTMKEVDIEPLIKYVDIDYPADIGLKKQYEDQGYRIRWFSDNRITRKIDIEGWEYAYQKTQNGKLFILKIKNKLHELTLLKKKLKNDI